MSDAITVLSDTIFVSLVNTTWQITLLIPLVALLIRVFRIKSAATRYSLWLFVLLAIITLPLITPFIPQIDMAQFRSRRAAGDRPDDLMRLGMGGGEVGELAENGNPVPSVGTAKVHANRGSDVSLINPVSIAYFIWWAGALFTFFITLGAHINLRRLKVNSPDVKDPAALEMLSRLRQRVKVRRPVALKVSSDIYTPMSLGIFSPTIILPDGVLDRSPFPNGRAPFSPFPKGGLRGISELEMILTHELAHIRRCDYLVNILQNILKAMFFFHPLYHLMNRSLAKEREHICDDWVIHVTEQRSGYAECIIGLLERALHKPVNVPVTLSMAERKRDIPGRIDMIVDKKRDITTKASTKALIAVFLIGCLVLPIIGGVGLVRLAGARPASDEGWIVFQRDRDIWIVDADGRNEKQLTQGNNAITPAWSPDGRKIAFVSNGPDIYVMNSDGSNVEKLTDIGGLMPEWSPDGKSIVFMGRGDFLDVIDAGGGNLRKLTGEAVVKNTIESSPAWSPDGKKIAFERTIVAPPQKHLGLYAIDADGKNEKLLDEWGMGAAWSPDGSKIAFHDWRLAFRHGISIMDADGANVKELVNLGSECYDAVWSPDGRRIAFASFQHGAEVIYVMDADGSNVQNLTNGRCPDWTAHSYTVEPAGKMKSTWGKIKSLIRPH